MLSRDSTELGWLPVVILLLAYTPLSMAVMGTSGILYIRARIAKCKMLRSPHIIVIANAKCIVLFSVPTGTFVPNLVIGSAMGRLLGKTANVLLPNAVSRYVTLQGHALKYIL